MDIVTFTLGLLVGGGIKWRWDKYKQRQTYQNLGRELAQAQAEIQRLKIK